MSQCYHGVGQVKTPIYLGAGPKGSRSCDNECTNFEQPFGPFCCKEEKAIAWAKRHALLEWDRLQVDLQYTPEVPNSRTCEVASF